MEDLNSRPAEPALIGILATLLAGIAIGAAAVMLANQQNELGGIKWPRFAPSEWRQKVAGLVESGKERIIRSVEAS